MSVKTKKKMQNEFWLRWRFKKKKKYCVNRCDGTVVTSIHFLQGGTKVMVQSNKPNCYTRLHIFLPHPVEVIFPIRNTLSSSDLMMMIVWLKLIFNLVWIKLLKLNWKSRSDQSLVDRGKNRLRELCILDVSTSKISTVEVRTTECLTCRMFDLQDVCPRRCLHFGG